MVHLAMSNDLEVVARASGPKTDLCSVVRHLTHELRQPLSAIEASAYYLEMIDAEIDPRATRERARIQQMVDQMACILSDACDLVQAEPVHPQWIDLMGLVATEMETSNVPFLSDPRTPVRLIRMDPLQAQHMARNLARVLALIAVPDSSQWLTFDREGSFAVLECGTYAQPIPCSEAESLFTPFTPHLPAGFGLALASVRRIAESHGGRATACCDNGRFTLRLSLPA